MNLSTVDVPHPGEFLREELEARDWSQRDLAYVLGVNEQTVTMLVSGKRGISADMARALGDALDVPAEFFANLQNAHDLSRAKHPDPNVARKGRLQSSFPVREMIKRGWLLDGDAGSLELQMAKFFEVSNPDEIPYMAHAAKKTDCDEPSAAQLAWLFRVRQIAREMIVSPYSEKALRRALVQLRTLATEPEEARHVPRILAECGVRYVLVECLPGSKIDGVCFWLNDGTSPVVAMSTRYDRIDNFWFVIRHEIEHILLRHGVDRAVIDAELEGERAGVGPSVSDEERAANMAAREFCVPEKRLETFIARKKPFISERDIIAFARVLQVHPGIVAGQIRRRLDKWTLFTKLLVKIRFAVAGSATVDGWGHVVPVSL